MLRSFMQIGEQNLLQRHEEVWWPSKEKGGLQTQDLFTAINRWIHRTANNEVDVTIQKLIAVVDKFCKLLSY